MAWLLLLLFSVCERWSGLAADKLEEYFDSPANVANIWMVIYGPRCVYGHYVDGQPNDGQPDYSALVLLPTVTLSSPLSLLSPL